MRDWVALVATLVVACVLETALGALELSKMDPDQFMPHVLELRPDNFDKHVGRPGVAAFVEFYATWCSHSKTTSPYWAAFGRAVAANNATDRLLVAKVDADKYSELKDRFGIGGFPTLLLFAPGTSSSTDAEKYPSSASRSVKNLARFVYQQLNITIQVPRANTNFIDVDASNFDAIVLDPTKHAFVLFFAPWCNYCVDHWDSYEKVAASFASEPSLRMVRVDASDVENEHLKRRYNIKTYPTMMWFGRGKKETPEDHHFSGLSRSVGDLVRFINDRAKTQREIGGALSSTAGTDSIMSMLAQRLVRAPVGSDARERIVSEMLLRAKMLDNTKETLLYVKAAKAITGGDEGFARREVVRLLGLRSSSSVTPRQRDEFDIKINILSSFVVVDPLRDPVAVATAAVVILAVVAKLLRRGK